MGRQQQTDSAGAWQQPSIYTFAGDYGPFKVKGHDPIEDTLVWLYNSGETNNDDDEDDHKDPQRHPMYPLATPIQDMLLDNRTCRFSKVMVIDVNDMFEDRDEYEEALQKEEESLELTKKLGKKLLRLFQKLLVHKVALAARGELCPLLLKLYKALEAIDASYNLEENNTIAELWLFHPQLSSKYVNTHLIIRQPDTTAAPQKSPKKSKRKNNGASNRPKESSFVSSSVSSPTKSTYPVQLNLIHTTALTNKMSVLKPAFPNIGVEFVQDEPICNLLSIVGYGIDLSESPEGYDPERCNDMGKMLFCSEVVVEMNKISKQHERNCMEITAELLAIIEPESDEDEVADPNAIDWSTVEQHVGALLLRGNRCILVRSVYGEWEGMRIPSVAPFPEETPQEAAIRAIADFAEVDDDEMQVLPHVLPVALYAPNGRPILVHVYPLYAVSPPPDYDDPADADLEDEEDPYDWYTFPRALARLDEASAACLKSMATNLVQASGVGLVPRKWGGVFGQELQL